MGKCKKNYKFLINRKNHTKFRQSAICKYFIYNIELPKPSNSQKQVANGCKSSMRVYSGKQFRGGKNPKHLSVIKIQKQARFRRGTNRITKSETQIRNGCSKSVVRWQGAACREVESSAAFKLARKLSLWCRQVNTWQSNNNSNNDFFFFIRGRLINSQLLYCWINLLTAVNMLWDYCINIYWVNTL